MHSQLREEDHRSPLHPCRASFLGASRLVPSSSTKRETERERTRETTSRTCRFASCGYREAGQCPCIAMRRTTCIVRQSSQRHVPVIAYSACNITKHHRGQTCKQRALPFTPCRPSSRAIATNRLDRATWMDKWIKIYLRHTACARWKIKRELGNGDKNPFAENASTAINACESIQWDKFMRSIHMSYLKSHVL